MVLFFPTWYFSLIQHDVPSTCHIKIDYLPILLFVRLYHNVETYLMGPSWESPDILPDPYFSLNVTCELQSPWWLQFGCSYHFDSCQRVIFCSPSHSLHPTSLLSFTVVVWMRTVPIGSCIQKLSPQLALFGEVMEPFRGGALLEEVDWLWRFISPRHFLHALFPTSSWYVRSQFTVSASMPSQMLWTFSPLK